MAANIKINVRVRIRVKIRASYTVDFSNVIEIAASSNLPLTQGYGFRVAAGTTRKGPFTRAIFVAILSIQTHAIEPLGRKSIDLYSFAQMV